ncbi:MAG: NADH-quinone oxidoreductase subunit M, partial [Smithellaceae bacterium]|nr:NADH-quinone oxidoreductase subunit M [Smithellaceae bacterium]
MILLWLLIIPLAGGLFAWVAGRKANLARGIALAAMAAELAVVAFIWLSRPFSGAPSLEFYLPWISSLGIGFHLAMDGVSLLRVLLTSFLGIAAVVCSWKEIDRRVGFFHFQLLAALAGIIGVFIAADL